MRSYSGKFLHSDACHIIQILTMAVEKYTCSYVTGYRLENVQIFIGRDIDSYQLAAYYSGTVQSNLTIYPEHVKRGHWAMVTRNTTIEEALTLCEVKVIGRRVNTHRKRTGKCMISDSAQYCY